MAKRTKLNWYGSGSGKARGLSVSFEKFGPWEKTLTQLASLDRNIKVSLEWGEKKAAQKIVKIVRNHLINQDLNWDVLDASTIARKEGDLRILIETETYLNSIKTWKSGGTRLVGVPKGVTNPLNGEEVWYIAQIHEFKSYNGGPFRALWGPSYEELGGGKEVRNIIYQVLFAKLLALGYPVSKEL